MNKFDSEISGKEKFLNNLSSFLVKNKTILIVFFAVIVVAIIGIGVVNSITDKKNNQASLLIEELQSDYDDWIEMSDEDEDRDEKKDELLSKIEGIKKDDIPDFAKKRVLFINAEILFTSEEWAEAAELFSESAEILKDSYLSPIGLMLAASSYENNSEYQKALDLYNNVYENYSKTYPETPRAMLAIARLYEQMGNNKEAIEAYNKLIDEFPTSQWSNLARTRIIHLED